MKTNITIDVHSEDDYNAVVYYNDGIEIESEDCVGPTMQDVVNQVKQEIDDFANSEHCDWEDGEADYLKARLDKITLANLMFVDDGIYICLA